MPDVILTKKIKSIKIYPATEATPNYRTSSMDVVWGSELPLPKTFTLIGWEGLAASPRQPEGYSGSRPVVDSAGLRGDITFDIAALPKKTSYDQDSLRIDKLVKASSKDLLINYPYFRVDVVRSDNSTYSLICGLGIRIVSKESKRWRITLKPNKVLDDDLTVEDVKLKIVKIDVADISAGKIRVVFYTNKSGRGYLYYDPLGGSVLNQRLTGSWGLYKHSFDVVVPTQTSDVRFKCSFQTDNSTEEITTEEKVFRKGSVSTPLVVTTPTFTPGSAAGRGFVRWTTDRPATSYAIADEVNPPTEVFAKTDLVQEHEVEVFFSTLATKVSFQAVSTDEDGYTGRSRVVTAYVTPTSPPIVSGLVVKSKTATGMVITFSTDKPCTAVLEYGISTGYGNKTTSSGVLNYTHEVEITGLDDYTDYHVRAEVTTASPGSQIGLSGEVVVKTESAPAPTILSYAVANTADPDKKLLTFTTNVVSRYVIEHSEDRYFSVSNKEPRSDTLSASHSYTLDISRYPNGTTIYVRVVLDDGNGNIAESSSNTISKSANNDVVVNDIVLDNVTIDEADFEVTLSGSAKIFLSFSPYEDMAEATIFATTSGAAVNHDLQGSIVGRGSGVDVWYTISVLNAAGTQTVYTSAPQKFTTPNEQSPTISNVIITKKYGQSNIILVKAKSNVPIFGEVRWGRDRNNLNRSVTGVFDYVNDHSIEVTVTDEIPSNSIIFLQIGGSGEQGIETYSPRYIYRYVRGTAALLISDLEDTNGASPNQRSIAWKTSEPTSATLFYGREDDVTDSLSLDYFRLDHRVFLDLGLFDTGDTYYYQIEARTSDGRVDTSAVMSGVKANPIGTISSITYYDVDQESFVVQCHTDKPGKIRVSFSFPGTSGQTGISVETTTNHSKVVDPTGATPGTIITWSVDFTPADGSPMVSSSDFTTTLATSGDPKARFELFRLSQDAAHVNVIQAYVDLDLGADVSWQLGLGRAGFTGIFARPTIGTGHQTFEIDFVASNDMLEKGFAWLKCLSSRTGYEGKETFAKNQFVGKSNTPSQMRTNIVNNVITSYNNVSDQLTISWGATGSNNNHVMYSTDGNQLALGNKLFNTASTNSPSFVLDTSGVSSGEWVFLRPISGKIIIFSGSPYKYEWHIGDITAWQKP